MDLVIKSGSIYHVYDLKRKGTIRDFVNKQVQFFPVGKGESAQRGTILEEYPEVLAPIFYLDPMSPGTVLAISFTLPTDKAGNTKPGQIHYEITRFSAGQFTSERQRVFVESRGFEWVPERFRITAPIEDIDRLEALKSLSAEGQLVYPEQSKAITEAIRLQSELKWQASLRRDSDKIHAEVRARNMVMTVEALSGAYLVHQFAGSGPIGTAASEGVGVTESAIPLLRLAPVAGGLAPVASGL